MNPASSKEITRDYFDSLLLEMRLMDSGVPNTEFELYGKRFATPIMTAALSHIGTFNEDLPSGMVQYAKGAAIAGAVHWIGMGAMAYTGVQTTRDFDSTVIHRI